MRLGRKIVLLMTFAAIASAAFAETDKGITVSGWGRAAFSPVGVMTESKGGEDVSHPNAGVGEVGRNFIDVEAYIRGATDFAGFGLDFYNGEPAEVNKVSQISALISNAYVWVKPFGNDLLKIQVGRFSDGTLQGKIGDLNNGFQAFVHQLAGTEGNIFSSFSVKNGVVISSAPPFVKGLFVGIKLDATQLWYGLSAYESEGNNRGVVSGDVLEDLYASLQAAIGYQIPGVGHIRFQFIGAELGKEIEFPQDLMLIDSYGIPASSLELAFALTAVPGLTLDLGGKFFLPLVDDTAFIDSATRDVYYTALTKAPIIALGVSYTPEPLKALTIAGRLDVSFGDTIQNDLLTANSGYNINAHLVPSWNFGFMKAGLDMGMSVKAAAKVDSSTPAYQLSSSAAELGELFGFGIGVFAEKSFGSARIKGGFAANLGKRRDGKLINPMSISVPIIIETWL